MRVNDVCVFLQVHRCYMYMYAASIGEICSTDFVLFFGPDGDVLFLLSKSYGVLARK